MYISVPRRVSAQVPCLQLTSGAFELPKARGASNCPRVTLPKDGKRKIYEKYLKYHTIRLMVQKSQTTTWDDAKTL